MQTETGKRHPSGIFPEDNATKTRNSDVAFGGPASWPKVLEFEKNLELGLIANDGSFGWAASPDVRDKWQTIPVVAGYPRFLWEQPENDPIFGRVNGRRALSSTQLAPGTILFGRWSEVLICSWLGIEILVDTG